jgi:hypothetical protein
MSMARPTGVTVIAVLFFLGAAFCLLGGIVMIAGGGFMATLINQQGGQGSSGAAGLFAGLGVVMGVVFLIGAAIEILLGIGLIKLKGWARMATIILTAAFAVLYLFGLLSSLAHFVLLNFVVTLAILAIQCLIIWYLLTPEVKAAFQAPQIRAASA